jgi:tRNA(Ile)-lysidine synthase
MDIVNSVWNIIKEYDLFPDGRIIIIGLSGGPDSVALVNILYRIKQRYNRDWNIILAHLNHHIRARQSDMDEKFCRKLAITLGLRIYVAHKKVIELSKKRKQSLEETARQERYRFFDALAKTLIRNKKRQIISIAVGHNLDDNAETVLFRIIRGTALKGLRAITIKRKLFDNSRFYLVRPLLYTTREGILSYLKTHNLPYRIDATNKDKKILRNRIRHELLPLLRQYNPQISEHLNELSETATLYYDFLGNVFKAKLPRRRKILSISAMKQEHPAIQTEMINRVLENIKGLSKTLMREHYSALLKLINSSKINQEIHLPRGVIARRQRDRLIIQVE